ncbi:MAG: adenosylmethionine--8-amino-7-oxononanoate transaminase [Bdellovibrionales bacterium]|nr:adenosylmethionine--8-amino-7-oxononanoate transaminase [Bdellovibrionales bacterium]
MKTKAKIWLPYTQMKKIKELPEAISAKGSLIHLKNGKKVIDAISSWWVITLGHCEPSIVKAVQKQAQEMDQVLFANFNHPPAKKLLKELQSILPKKLPYIFFSDNGSTAVESALKMAVQSWKQTKGEAQRNTFISFKNSYHGDTVGAMSVSGRNLFTYPYKKLLFSVVRVKQGTRSSDPVSAYVSDFSEKVKKYHATLAGVIIEPFIQGAGGMIMWPKEALKEICSISKKKGLYLIFDEVMTGFGRTGELFAFQKLGITPDLLCLSKGLTGGFLPLALTVANKTIYDSFLSDEKKLMFFHGHSFTGNPISCVAAAANIKEIKKTKWKKEWSRIESFHQKKIHSLKGHKNLIDIRGCGTIAAMEFRVKNQGYSSSFAEEFSKKAFQRGVFLRPLGNIVYILPPYCTSNKELEQTWSAIEEELNP